MTNKINKKNKVRIENPTDLFVYGFNAEIHLSIGT